MTYFLERDPPYTSESNFTVEQLQEIVPGDLVNYFNFRTYSNENPGEFNCPTGT